MANFIGDLSLYQVSGTLFATSTGVSTSANASGSSIDTAAGASNIFTAVQVVGNVAGTTPTMDAKMQESTDGTTWTDVTGGTFTQVVTSNQVEAIGFKPTKRYVRSTATVSGTSPVFEATVLVLMPRRTAPANDGGWDTTAVAGNG